MPSPCPYISMTAGMSCKCAAVPVPVLPCCLVPCMLPYRATLLTYAVAIALHAWVLWLVTKSPGRYNPARNLLTCVRWLLVRTVPAPAAVQPISHAVTQGLAGPVAVVAAYWHLAFESIK